MQKMADPGYSSQTVSSTNLDAVEQSQSQYRSDEEDEDEKVLEVSKNKRWNKMAVQVTQREVPGIDNAYLAIDTEEGMEAVWNEVMYSQRKTRLNHKERLSSILSKVIKVKHRNIVSFYDFWLDKDPENQDRLVFITEYMTSGSLLQFLKTKKRNPTAVGDKGRKVSKETPWKRWCKQILSALW
jgi:nuclear receptor-binding protein